MRLNVNDSNVNSIDGIVNVSSDTIAKRFVLPWFNSILSSEGLYVEDDDASKPFSLFWDEKINVSIWFVASLKGKHWGGVPKQRVMMIWLIGDI